MIEIWKDIPGYEDMYQVSSYGRVKSLPREWVDCIGRKFYLAGKVKKLSITTTDSGRKYKNCGLNKNKNTKNYQVHQLVAMAFFEHIPDGTTKIVVDHINNDSLDNRLENLQLITNRENCSKDRKGGASKFVGVSWSLTAKKWLASIQINNVPNRLGLFEDEYAAHKAYQKALKIFENGGDIKKEFPDRKLTSNFKFINKTKYNKWIARVTKNGIRYYLGTFEKEGEAVKVVEDFLKKF